MAARSFVQLLGAADPGVVVLGINWATNGSSDPVASTITGRGVASVVLTSTGVYTVTLQDVYPSLLSATASVQLASADDKVAANIGAVDLNAKTIQVRIYDLSSAALANVAAATGNRVNLTLVLKNSQV
jgi:hypothetical protein